MNVRKSRKGHRTVTFKPYGRVPLRDAKESVSFTLSQDAIRLGKKNNPAGCAIALQSRHDAIANEIAKIPNYLAIEVRKTTTHVAVSRKSGIAVLRWVHSPELTKLINGFDTDQPVKLKAGDTITLLAPKGARRIGKSNGTSHSGSIKPLNPRPRKQCVRRGVYLDPVHAKQAKQEDSSLSIRA